MNSDHTTSRQSGHGELAPSKLADNTHDAAIDPGAAPAPHNADEAGFTPAQHNGHEDNISADSTLPLGEGIQGNITVTRALDRAVMWAAPGSPGSRSESPSTALGTAGSVTPEAPAEQGGSGGAMVAGTGAAKLAQPAWQSVTEANADEAGVRHGTGGNVGDACGHDGHGIGDHANEGFGRDGVPDGPLVGGVCVDGAVGREGFVDEGAAAAPVSPPLDELEVQENYDVVRKARAALAAIQAEHKRRKDHAVSAGTIKDYEGDLRVLEQRGRLLEEEVPVYPICAALAHYAPSASSFYKMRAAALLGARSKVESLLAEQSRRQQYQPQSQWWDLAIMDLRRALWELGQVQALSREAARELNDAPVRLKRSKKLVLKRARNDWQQRFFDETEKSVQYRHACFLAGTCGMRPKELQTGVMVQLLGKMVGIQVEGAKVTETAGQTWRTVFIQAKHFPDWFLADLSEVPRQFSARAAGMRGYLYRLSPKVFPKEGDKPQLLLSDYVLRHAVATDLWQEGWSTLEIAGVLGERVEETVRNYGLRTRGAKWRETHVLLERGSTLTAQPVRARDRRFIEQKALAGAKGKKAAKQRRAAKRKGP